MPEGLPNIERSHDQEYIALRQQLDHILTDQGMDGEARKSAFKEFIGIVNRKRDALKGTNGSEVALFEALAAEAETEWVNRGNEPAEGVE